MNINKLQKNTTWGIAVELINNNLEAIGLAIDKSIFTKDKNKGYFTSDANLKSKVPNPKSGDSAYVGATYPGVVYYCVNDGTWVNSGKAPVIPDQRLSDTVGDDSSIGLSQKGAKTLFANVDSNFELADDKVNCYIDGIAMLSNTSIKLLNPFTIWLDGSAFKTFSSTVEIQYQSANRQNLLLDKTSRSLSCVDYTATIPDNNVLLGSISPSGYNKSILKMFNNDQYASTYRNRSAGFLKRAKFTIIKKLDSTYEINLVNAKLITNSFGDSDKINSNSKTVISDISKIYIVFVNVSSGRLLLIDNDSPVETDYNNLIWCGYLNLSDDDYYLPFTNNDYIFETDEVLGVEDYNVDLNSAIDKGVVFLDTRNVILAGELWTGIKIVSSGGGKVLLHTFKRDWNRVSTREIQVVNGDNTIAIDGMVNDFDLLIAIEIPSDSTANLKTIYPKTYENVYGIKRTGTNSSDFNWVYSGYKFSYSVIKTIKPSNTKSKVIDITNSIINDKYIKIESDISIANSLYEDTNLYNKDTDIVGEINSRWNDTPVGIGKLDGWNRSDFIPIEPEQYYTLQTSSNSSFTTSLTFYDKDFNVIVEGYSKILTRSIIVKSPVLARYCSFNTKQNLAIVTDCKFFKSNAVGTYSAYLDGKVLKDNGLKSYIDSNSPSGSTSDISKVVAFRSGNFLYVRSHYDDTYDVVNRCEIKSHYNNDNFNFELTYLVEKSGSIGTQSVIIKNSPDDIAPIQLEGRSYYGGNHGIDNSIIATVQSHGKTNANLGDVYLDNNGRKFYIVNIIDGNTLHFLSENIGASDILFTFGNASGNLSRGGEIIPNSALAQNKQLHPSTRDVRKLIYADNVELIENVQTVCDKVLVVDEYNCIDPVKVLQYVIDNKVTWQVATTKVTDAQIALRNSFTFDRFGIIGTNNISVLVNANKVRFGAISFDPLTRVNNENLRLHIPKTKSFVHGGTTYDFTGLQLWNSNFVNDGWIYFTDAMYESNKLPDRWTEYIESNGNIKYAASAGFIQLADGINSKRVTTADNMMVINGFRKCYGRGFDFKLTFNDAQIKRDFEFMWFRQFFNVSNPNKAISTNRYKINGKLYINVDYSTYKGIDYVDIIDLDYLGKEVNVFEKSDNINVLSNYSVINGIKLEKTDYNYGYITLVIG